MYALLRHYPVDDASGIVADVDRSFRADNDVYRAAHPLAFVGLSRLNEAGNEVFFDLGFPLFADLYANNFVSGWAAAIPGTVKCDQQVIVIVGGEQISGVEGQS